MNTNPEYDEDYIPNDKPIVSIGSILPPIKRKADKGIHSEEHDLAKQICDYFHENKFGMWLGIIKRNGVQKVYQAFAEAKQSRGKTPVKILMWKLKKKKDEEKKAN